LRWRRAPARPAGLRERCRPALLRLGASLGDSVFLLVRAGFDAMCLDRWEGPFPDPQLHR
jgi:DNA-binding IclR family transcriptional regulator